MKFNKLKTYFLLRRARRGINPRPEFRRALALRIESELVLKGQKNSFFSILNPRSLAVPVAVVLVSTMVGTGTFAFASDDVVDGHVLYPVRRQIERAEVALSVTPERRINARLRHADRRLEEVEVLVERDPQKVDKTLSAAGYALQVGREQALHLPEKKRQVIIQVVQHRDGVFLSKLEQLAKTHEDIARYYIEEQLRLSGSRLKNQMLKIKDPRQRKIIQVQFDRRKQMYINMTAVSTTPNEFVIEIQQ